MAAMAQETTWAREWPRRMAEMSPKTQQHRNREGLKPQGNIPEAVRKARKVRRDADRKDYRHQSKCREKKGKSMRERIHHTGHGVQPACGRGAEPRRT